MALAGDSASAVEHIRTLAALGIDSMTVFPLGPARMQTARLFPDCVVQALGGAADARD
jgi:hypothetical protein